MKPKYTQHNLQTLPSGDQLTIDHYSFDFEEPGPEIYLQANLHGAEIIGTVILKELIDYLKQNPYEKGKVKITPCANPLAVIDKSYTSIQGRFNPVTGTNWNRIFHLDNNQYETIEQAQQYFKDQLNKNLSTEDRLSYTLKLLSCKAEYIVDIHTSGVETIPYLFTHKDQHELFSPLGAEVHIEEKEESLGSSFEDYQHANYKDIKNIYACTWEAGTHNVIEKDLAIKRKNQLIDFLDSQLKDKNEKVQQPDRIVEPEEKQDIHAPVGGYYVWNCDVGDKINSGTSFLEVYRPDRDKVKKIKAEQDLMLLCKNKGQAFSEGESVGVGIEFGSKN